MKSMELKISLMKKRKSISRTILVTKKTTYEQLHEMIQLLFNLDNCEAYSFEIDQKVIQKDKKQSEKKSLMNIKDVFYYHYDLVESLHFKIEVLQSNETIDTPKCIQAVGKNLYEGLNGQVESKYQSKFDMNWINACLSYFNENKKKEFYYEVKERIKELKRIRYFQDYMHNQIVQIHLPQNRAVYMACDASEDVILNFHINSNKLLEYTSINQKAISQSVVKYHDCIELCMIKKSFVDEKIDFDFSVDNYGIFLSYANVCHNEEIPVFFMHMYLKAFDQYIKVMKYCQENQIKFKDGKMLNIDIHNEITVNNGQMVIYNISFLDQKNAEKIRNEYSINQSKVEIDVLTRPKGVNELETICVVGDSVNGHLDCEIYNASIKTMLVHIFSLLQERWKKIGMDAVLVVRDKNLGREFEYLAELLGIEYRLEDKLPSIDAKYITMDHASIENMDPKTIILRLLEELGIDPSNIQSIDTTNEILEKLKKMKDDKKYS